MLHCLRFGLGTAVLGAWLPTASPLVAAADGESLARQSPLSFQHLVVDAQPPLNPWVKLAGDFNGDGRPDILGANHGGPLQPVELWLSQAPKRAATRAGRAAVHSQ
jgi:FG-GAP repeat